MGRPVIVDLTTLRDAMKELDAAMTNLRLLVERVESGAWPAATQKPDPLKVSK